MGTATAATWVAAALRDERFIYVFGSGHSHTLGEEAFYRAGGLVRAVAILDENLMVHKSATGSTDWERKEGYAAEVLARCPLAAGDILFVVSSSGRNAAPIEMALAAQSRGAKVIAISSRQYSGGFPSRRLLPSPARLFGIPSWRGRRKKWCRRADSRKSTPRARCWSPRRCELRLMLPSAERGRLNRGGRVLSFRGFGAIRGYDL